MAAKKKDTVETVETEAVIQEAAEDQKAEDVQTDPEGKQEDQEEEELSPIAKRYQVFLQERILDEENAEEHGRKEDHRKRVRDHHRRGVCVTWSRTKADLEACWRS